MQLVLLTDPAQPYSLSALQLPILLALHEEVGGTRVQQFCVQRVAGARARRGVERGEAEPREVALLLRPVQQPRAERAARPGPVRADEREDGGGAGDGVVVLDRGEVHAERGGRADGVQAELEVVVRDGVFFAAGEPEADL